MIKNKTKSICTASVNDGYLNLSFLKAEEPVIWRKSLDDIGAARFEVKEKTIGGDPFYALNLKKNKTSETIAVFSDRGEAVEAMTLASQALHGGGQTKIAAATHNASAQNTARQADKGSKKTLIFILLGIIVLLYFLTVFLTPERGVLGEQNSAQTQSAPAVSAPARNGVPLSADDFLRGQ